MSQEMLVKNGSVDWSRGIRFIVQSWHEYKEYGESG